MPYFGDTEGSKAPKHTTHESAQGTRINAGPFIGTIKNNIDPQRAGRLQVWIAELGGNPDDQSSWRTVSYASPFYGVTPPGYNSDGQDRRPDGQNFETNPHSYGFWMVPPDIGVKILCMFVNGDPFKGYWFACIPDWPNMHMVPAIAGNDKNPLPLVEYNDDAPDDITSLNSFHNRQTQAHQEQVKILQKQGLDQDKDRGLITSSAFRESPSAVFGFSTPGALLKGEEGQQTGTGRKGGHSFVMDDGDAEDNNQLIRLRSSSGHMLMLNDSNGFIYVTNADGTAWFELDSTGNINFYADGDIQMAAKGNIHFEAGKSVKIKGKDTVDILSEGANNITGKKSISIGSDGMANVEGKKGLHLKGENAYLTGDKCIQINGGKHLDLGASCLNLNSTQPTKAKGAQAATGPQGMPTKEPWQGHKSGGKGRSSGVSRGGVGFEPGPIGTTGGIGPGSTGFRQGKDTADVNYDYGGGMGSLQPGTPSSRLTDATQASINRFADSWGMNRNSLTGILNIESRFDTSVRGGAGGNYYGIFQLQGSQIPGLTQQALGVSMTPSQYRSLSVDQQLQVMNKYYENAGIPKSGFFTGDARQDASRAWALQLAPGNAKRLNYNDPNTVISRTNQASNISAAPGVVTVGSVQSATIASGGVRTLSTTPTPVQDNTVGYVAPNEEENLRDQQRADSRGVDFADTEADVQRLEAEMEGRQQDFGSDPVFSPPQQDFGNDRSLALAPTFTQPLPSTDSWYNQPQDGMSGRTFDDITGGQSPSQPSFMGQGVSPSWSNIDTSSDRNTETFDPRLSGELAPETVAPGLNDPPPVYNPAQDPASRDSPALDYSTPPEKTSEGRPAPGTIGDLDNPVSGSESGSKPVGGGSKPPGAGGQGPPGTPTNRAPQSSTKPAC